MKKFLLKDVGAILNALSEKMGVYAPIKENDVANFLPYSDGKEIDLDCLKTVKSAKECIFPKSEDLAKFKVNGKKITVESEELSREKFVVFGARACDIRGFAVLDKVFLSEPVDTFYKSRRDNAYIVGYACTRPSESCFCNVFGIDMLNPDGDVTIYKTGDFFFWKENTDKGRELTEIISAFLTEAEYPDYDLLSKALNEGEAVREKLPFGKLDLTGFDGEHLMEKFDSEKWQQLSDSCLGCGTCTFVCPTCQCYDIRDFKTNSGVSRYRCWDSCMYSDFTLMAHGNPRITQLQRFRQRFMHKLVYFPANNDGMYSCVGCGRCVDRCPVSMNIVKVIRTLGEDKDE